MISETIIFTSPGQVEILLSHALPIPVVGSAAEESLLINLKKSVPELAIQIILRRYLRAQIAGSRLFICLDSDPMYFALCLNMTVLALFGPGDSELCYPLSSFSKFVHFNQNINATLARKRNAYSLKIQACRQLPSTKYTSNLTLNLYSNYIF